MDVEQIEVASDQSVNQKILQPLLKGRALVVEFVGPTGSGKSTNCNFLSLALKREGLYILLFSDIKKYFWDLSLYKRTRLIISTINKDGRSLLQYVFLLIKYRIFSFDSISRYFRLCVFNRALEQVKTKEKPDIILLDQWVIQGLWSALIFRSDKHQPSPAEIQKFLFKSHLVIYFDLDIVTANERIKTRNSGDSRFDRMTEPQRLNALGKYTHYLLELYKQSDCKIKQMFSAYESPERNAEKFLLLLQFELNKFSDGL
jgi:thymidylate kinase